MSIEGISKTTDLSFLKNLTQLKSLNLAFLYPLSDLKFLENLINLEFLTLDFIYGVYNLNFLKKLQQLKSLNLRNMPKIDNLNLLKYLPYFDRLSLHDVNINDIDLIDNLKQVKLISTSTLDSNLDYKTLSQMPNLENLDVRNTPF